MELFSYEMHLACQHRLITLSAQVVGVSRHIATQGRCIVPRCDLGGQLARHKGRTCGSAQGGWAIGRGEDFRFGGKFVDVGGFDGRVLVVDVQEGGRDLVRKNEKNIGLSSRRGMRVVCRGRDSLGSSRGRKIRYWKACHKDCTKRERYLGVFSLQADCKRCLFVGLYGKQSRSRASKRQCEVCE